MKNIKKTVAIIMALALALSFAACGKTTPANNTNNTANEVEPVPTPPETGEEDGEPVVDPDYGLPDVDDPTENSKETLVVYFSATGTTKSVAEKIAELTDADIYEIVPEVPYTAEDIDYGDAARASIEQKDDSARPAIAGESISLKSYTAIYIGYPIWYGQAPRILCTFVETYSFGDILVIPFCTSDSSSIGDSAINLEKLSNGGIWAEGGRLDKDISAEDLAAWVEQNH